MKKKKLNLSSFRELGVIAMIVIIYAVVCIVEPRFFFNHFAGQHPAVFSIFADCIPGGDDRDSEQKRRHVIGRDPGVFRVCGGTAL